MRFLSILALLVAGAAPAAAFAQADQSALQGQSTAVQLTRQQALRDVEHAGYSGVSHLTLGPDGGWMAMTSEGAVKVGADGQVVKTE